MKFLRFTVIGMTVIGIVADSEMTRTVSHGDTGTLLGVANSAITLCIAISPMISTNLLKSHGFPMFGIVGIIFTAVNCFIIYSLSDSLKRVEEKHEDWIEKFFITIYDRQCIYFGFLSFFRFKIIFLFFSAKSSSFDLT